MTRPQLLIPFELKVALSRHKILGLTRPYVVTLCGSTRFYELFMRANFELTMLGVMVYSVGFFQHSAERLDWANKDHGQNVGISESEKIFLDILHKKKIDDSNAILVLNKEGYIGDSTRSEIEHAKSTNKSIFYLEM